MKIQTIMKRSAYLLDFIDFNRLQLNIFALKITITMHLFLFCVNAAIIFVPFLEPRNSQLDKYHIDTF